MNDLIVQKMTSQEAQQLVVEINSGISAIGGKILELYEREGWKALGYSTWRDCAMVELNFQKSHVYELLNFAKVTRTLTDSAIAENLLLPASERQARPLTKLSAEEQAEAWQEAVETAPNGKITARHVEEVVNYKLAASNHTTIDTEGYDGDEWYTPIEQIEAARGLMGSIDLDPATCEKAQEIIQAKNYYTKLDNGLNQKWEGNIWLNPPYSQPLINHFVNKLIDDYQGGLIYQAVVLVNNSSDTKWFQSLLCKYIACFTKGRIPFWRPDQTSFSTRQGQVFFYLGNNEIYFQDIFSQFGTIVKAIK